MKIFPGLMKFWLNFSNLLISFIFFLLFLIVGITTLPDYGISWDSPIHFRRGQAYLNFFLTGKSDFQNLTGRKSFYQDSQYPLYSKVNEEPGHPPLNDVLASIFNYALFQKLGVIGDIESYHLFIVIASAILVATVFFFASEVWGVRTAIFSAFFLFAYPLFWSESHFNIKDPPLALFFALAIFLFWKGSKTKKIKYIYFSAIAAGFGLSIKFNIFSVLLIIPIWLITETVRRKKILKIVKLNSFWPVVFLYPVIMFLILMITWPYLWSQPIDNLSKIISFYRGVGFGETFQGNFLFFGFNLYPIYWITITTPPLILALFILGMIQAFFSTSKDKSFFSLLLIWFGFTIFRVSFPRTTIYGGVRQIMEYIPAMAILAGLGGNWLVETLSKKISRILAFLIVVLPFAFLILNLVRIHPNENVYFNFLVGGLKGAFEKSIPGAGNTFGNIYKQGLEWVNENLPDGSSLTLIQGTTSNLPLFEIRPDINYSNYNFSGIGRKGEYIMEMTYNYETKAYYYAWEYVEKFLLPVYEVKVDGVPLLKIWKNDMNYTADNFKKPERDFVGEIKVGVEDGNLILDYGKEVVLSRLIIIESQPQCLSELGGYVETSNDGFSWIREKDFIPSEQIGRKKEIVNSSLTYFFAGRETRYVRIVPAHKNPCLWGQVQTYSKII